MNLTARRNSHLPNSPVNCNARPEPIKIILKNLHPVYYGLAIFIIITADKLIEWSLSLGPMDSRVIAPLALREVTISLLPGSREGHEILMNPLLLMLGKWPI